MNIRAPRLLFRAMQLADADAVFTLRSDEGYEFIGTRRSREDFDLRFPNELARPGRNLMCICRKGDGSFVGEATYAVSPEGEADFTVAVTPVARGNKFGDEAAAALMTYLRKEPNVMCLVARVREDNKRGLMLTKKLGFAACGTLTDQSVGDQWVLLRTDSARGDA